jgi:hypothetical protein
MLTKFRPNASKLLQISAEPEEFVEVMSQCRAEMPPDNVQYNDLSQISEFTIILGEQLTQSMHSRLDFPLCKCRIEHVASPWPKISATNL